MSLFDDFNVQSFADAGDIIGRETFTVSGLTGSFAGVLNEFAAEKEVDVGGVFGSYAATLMCDLDAFDDLEGSIEKTVTGRKVTINGRLYRIDRCAIDEVSVTLALANPSKGK